MARTAKGWQLYSNPRTGVFQVRFGLAPLKRISEALAAIRAGTAERLEGRERIAFECPVDVFFHFKNSLNLLFSLMLIHK